MQVPTQSQTDTFNFVACTDGDNNNYTVVQIGTQTWMEQNLKTTKYNTGTAIPLVTDNTAWTNLSTPGYCWYNNSINNKNIYGGLYNWYAVNKGTLCPSGWHVPDTTDWKTLINYLAGDAGGKLKEPCTTRWTSPNSGATNSCGFTAFPGGNRSPNGGFFNQGTYSYWWTSSEVGLYTSWAINLENNSSYAIIDSWNNWLHGYSVRCIMD